MKQRKKLCEYGCGKEAKHQFKNGRWCCSIGTRYCPGVIKKRKNTLLKNPIKIIKPKKIITDRKCDYGCNTNAKYYFQNEKYCCSENVAQCSFIRKINIKKNKGRKTWNKNKPRSIKTKQKISQKNKGNIAWNKGMGEYLSKETRKKVADAHKGTIPWNRGKTITIKELKERYLTFVKVEEMRYEPGFEKEKIIQVHCKNNKCKNSKEQGGWFTPLRSQIENRRRAIEDINGLEGCYFYCSDKCKDECPLFNKSVNQLIKVDQIRVGHLEDSWYNSQEYQTWRNQVFKLDNNKCVWCGKEAMIVHHILPQKIYPELSLDPENGLSSCQECHYKYGHRDKWCTTGYLSTLTCKRIIRIKEKI